MIRLSGRLRSSLIIGGQGIRARKLRTFLSMVSLFLGVLAVVTVQAGAEIAERALLADVELAQGRDGTVEMYLPPSEHTVAVTLDTLKGATNAVAMIDVQGIVGEPGVSPVNPGAAPFDQSGGFYYRWSAMRRATATPAPMPVGTPHRPGRPSSSGWSG